jgi:hypothetical protein
MIPATAPLLKQMQGYPTAVRRSAADLSSALGYRET